MTNTGRYIRAVLWDMDGTLMDSQRFSRAVSTSQAPLTSMRTFPERPMAERTASSRSRSAERRSRRPETLTLAVLATMMSASPGRSSLL